MRKWVASAILCAATVGAVYDRAFFLESAICALLDRACRRSSNSQYGTYIEYIDHCVLKW